MRDYSNNPEIITAIEDARETILCCWEDWEQFAGEEAQREQDNEVWFAAMNSQIEAVLYGLLDNISSLDIKEKS